MTSRADERDQAAFDRIQMHVLELLNPLLMAPDVKIMEAKLPKMRQCMIGIEVELQLRGRRLPVAAQLPGDALLEYLQDRGRRTARGLADQQMDMFGHNHEAHQREAIAITDLGENLYEGVLGAGRTQQRQAAVTTAGDEV